MTIEQKAPPPIKIGSNTGRVLLIINQDGTFECDAADASEAAWIFCREASKVFKIEQNRLGIIEGLEMAAKWHDDMMGKSDLAHEAFHQICGIAIRALIEEQKV